MNRTGRYLPNDLILDVSVIFVMPLLPRDTPARVPTTISRRFPPPPLNNFHRVPNQAKNESSEVKTKLNLIYKQKIKIAKTIQINNSTNNIVYEKEELCQDF